MYQLAESPNGDSVVLFVESCTSMAPTTENLTLIKSTASLMRVALERDDINPLRDLIAKANEWCHDISDVLAAASHYLVETLGQLPIASLHSIIERVAEIERAVLPADVFEFRMEGFAARAVVG
jgi:hypothetical protein